MYNNYTGASGMNYGGGLNMTQQQPSFDWKNFAKSAIPSIAGGIGGWMGGNSMANGFDQYGNQVNQAMDKEQQYYDQGNQYFQPYYDQGTQSMGQLSQMLNGMSNPSEFINGLMGDYSLSPMAQFQMQEGERAANNAAAAGGQLGSPAEQMGLMRYAQGVSSQDQQNYINNALGVNNQALQGLQGLTGMGFNAAQGMNQNRMGLADNLTELLQNLGLSQMNAGAARSGGLGDLIGGITGALSFF